MRGRALLVTALALGATAYACGGRTPLQGGPVPSPFEAGGDAGVPPRDAGRAGIGGGAGAPRDAGTDAKPPDAGMPDAELPDAGLPDAEPPDAALVPNVISPTAGGGHSCVQATDGRVFCWGANDSAQLGDGTTLDRATATEVSGLLWPHAVVAYDRFSCAVLADSSVACWGYAVDQRLGSVPADPDPPYGISPVVVPEVAGVLELSRGSTASHACALTVEGLYCWGNNRLGQLGRGDSSDSEGVGAALGSSNGFTAAVGRSDTCLVAFSGALRCWGETPGNGHETQTVLLSTVEGVEGAGDVGVGNDYGCVRLLNGDVQCWGFNGRGQLGDGTSVSRADPRKVEGLSYTLALAVGANHACAIAPGPQVLCWGANEHGQLGDGTHEDRTRPVPVRIEDVVEIAAGDAHTCGRRAHGGISCWGANDRGQLGNGTTADSALPVAVLGLP